MKLSMKLEEMREKPQFRRFIGEFDNFMKLICSTRNRYQIQNNLPVLGIEGNLEELEKEIEAGNGTLGIIPGFLPNSENPFPVVNYVYLFKDKNNKYTLDESTDGKPENDEYEYDMKRVSIVDIQMAIDTKGKMFLKQISLA